MTVESNELSEHSLSSRTTETVAQVHDLTWGATGLSIRKNYEDIRISCGLCKPFQTDICVEMCLNLDPRLLTQEQKENCDFWDPPGTK
jgi:hypothetical protein